MSTELKTYEVRVKETHILLYTVEAKDEDDARDKCHEDPRPITVDAYTWSIESVKEVR